MDDSEHLYPTPVDQTGLRLCNGFTFSEVCVNIMFQILCSSHQDKTCPLFYQSHGRADGHGLWKGCHVGVAYSLRLVARHWWLCEEALQQTRGKGIECESMPQATRHCNCLQPLPHQHQLHKHSRASPREHGGGEVVLIDFWSRPSLLVSRNTACSVSWA